MDPITPPYFPIIYVRGFAALGAEVADTVATPYMGFNDGSTKVRRDYAARPQRVVFESPLVRLMKDHGYRDIYRDGDEVVRGSSPRLIVIHRYYDRRDEDLGTGARVTVPEAARMLSDRILTLRDQMYDKSPDAASFGVHLVAHSMGGLVCRAFLQNDEIGDPMAKTLVRRFFTYATPHNGVTLAEMDVPGLLSLFMENQFNKRAMTKYLALPPKSRDVDSLNGKFDPRRVYCLVGTNYADYTVLRGLVQRLAGPESDGLVLTANATVQGAAAGWVHRSHSGHYGIVNSGAGYYALRRFLFGRWRIDGHFDADDLPRPPSFDIDPQGGKGVQTAHQIEVAVFTNDSRDPLTERKVDHDSAIVLRENQLVDVPVDVNGSGEFWFDKTVPLFTTYATEGFEPFAFNVQLAVSPTEYAVNGVVVRRRFTNGEYLFQDTIAIRLEPLISVAEREGLQPGHVSWMLRYARTNLGDWAEAPTREPETVGTDIFEIPLATPNKLTGRLRISVTPMTDEPNVVAPTENLAQGGGSGEPDRVIDSGDSPTAQPVEEEVQEEEIEDAPA